MMNSTSGRIQIIVGSMFAGKTNELLGTLNTYGDSMSTKKILYINHSLDTRTAAAFSTHGHISGLSKRVDAIKLKKLSDYDAKTYDIIGIDEGQFFDDLVEYTLAMCSLGKIIVVASLDLDCFKRPFGHVAELLGHADTVTKLHTYCRTCGEKGIISNAIYTKRVTNEKDTVSVGGKDKYIAVCRLCY